MLTNAVGQTAKSTTPIYIMPVDLRPGTTVTMRPGGERLELKIRAIDVENTEQAAHDGGHHRVRIALRDRGHPPRLRGAAGRRLVRVSVDTGCRLHLGFTNLSDDVGRCCGSLGVALDRPSTTVVVEEGATRPIVGGDRGAGPRVRAALLRPLSGRPRGSPSRSARASRSTSASARARSSLWPSAWAWPRSAASTPTCGTVAAAMGRGRRSGIGMAAFQAGGFVIDAGHRKGAPARARRRPSCGAATFPRTGVSSSSFPTRTAVSAGAAKRGSSERWRRRCASPRRSAGSPSSD